MAAQQLIGAADRVVDETGLAQPGARLGERGDRHRVPRGDDLVVAGGLDTSRPGVEQRGAHGAEAVAVLRIRRELQRRTPVFESALFGHDEQLGGPTSRLRPEHLGEFVRSPHVRGALHPAGIGVERRGEPARHPEIPSEERHRFLDDAVRERISGPSREVRVGT
ncbi:hypothetical protein MTX80_21105 [Gordonia amicalis]|nr:hypothetical protein [Gordonia amicalis]UOG23646.1 hypothetical protein MTX80_21105 [Gordonia amicalis]